MKNKPYIQKRQYLLSSEIPYLKEFGEKYETFDEESIESRTEEIIEKLKNLFVISIEHVNERLSKLDRYFDLKSQLVIAFGKDSGYVKALEDRGFEKFIKYIYMNGALPSDDIDKIMGYVKMKVDNVIEMQLQ